MASTPQDDRDIFERYSRQMLFPPIGREGQEKIRNASVGLVGLGALGATIAELLVRAGVGRLVAVDRDVVEATNLHRQGLYGEKDAELRLPKAVAAANALRSINDGVEVDARVEDLGARNAEEVFRDCDLLLDGTDGFETRYLINDLAVSTERPWIYGACVASSGMTATILPGETPCLACLFPEAPAPGSQETCDTAGIIAPAAQIVASLQVTEALKILTDQRGALRPGLLSLELWPFRIVEIGRRDAKPRKDCRCCGARDFSFLAAARETKTVSLCGRNAVQIVPADRLDLDFEDIERRLSPLGQVANNGFSLEFDEGTFQITVFRDGRGLVRGTDDPKLARGAYQRYLGI